MHLIPRVRRSWPLLAGLFMFGVSGALSPALAQASGDRNVAQYQQVLARYDQNEDGWLSGTELERCGCAAYDLTQDGEVTLNEFVAGMIMAESGLAPAPKPLGTPQTATRSPVRSAPSPARPTPQQPARPAPTPPRAQPRTPSAPPRAQPAPPSAPARATGMMPTGRYTCYYTRMMQVMVSGMVITVQPGGRYQYNNGGGGTYRLNGGTVEWLSGPLRGTGARSEFVNNGAGERPMIRLIMPVDGPGATTTQTHRCSGPVQ